MSAPLLLIQEPGAAALHLTGGGRFRRLVAVARAWRLDQALAAGAHPDSRVELSLRAQRLLRRSTRLRLAAELQAVVHRAQRPVSITDPKVLLARAAILENREAIQEIVAWLADLTPIDIGGVAQLRLLLRDGASPLYPPSEADALEEALGRIHEALVPSSSLWMSA
jgi:hypothetical protein